MGKSSNSAKDIHSAARDGDLNTVRSICSSNPLAINSRDKHSRSPLHLAAWSGHNEVVNYLCKQKADFGASAIDDTGSIHFAAQKGHLDVVRTLISCGVHIESSTRKGLTALHYAVQGSHVELVKYLVKKGASLSAKTKAGKFPIDLVKNDEIRSLLVKPDNVRSLDGNETGEGSENLVNLVKFEVEFENSKRKVDEVVIEEVYSEQKKAKVTLGHLLSENDAQDDENV